MHFKQCDPNGEISPLWQIIKNLGVFPRVYLVFGKILNLLLQKFYAIGQIFFVVKGQNWTNHLAIWSHCLQVVNLILLNVCKLRQPTASFKMSFFSSEISSCVFIERKNKVKECFKMSHFCDQPIASVTRLDDFWKFLVANFLTKVAQTLGEFWAF